MSFSISGLTTVFGTGYWQKHDTKFIYNTAVTEKESDLRYARGPAFLVAKVLSMLEIFSMDQRKRIHSVACSCIWVEELTQHHDETQSWSLVTVRRMMDPSPVEERPRLSSEMPNLSHEHESIPNEQIPQNQSNTALKNGRLQCSAALLFTNMLIDNRLLSADPIPNTKQLKRQKERTSTLCSKTD